MMLFCGVGFAQDKEVMVVRQTNGKEVCYDVTRVEKVYVRTESACVDLGLPSGLKWATCNLGANAPEEAGDCYGWGCTEPYAEGESDDWPLYFQKLGSTASSYSACGTDKDPLKDYVAPNDKSIAGTEWDASRKTLGGKWRMPSKEDFEELQNTDNCTWDLTTENGVKVYKVTSTKNGNSIVLPALSALTMRSSYWTSTPGGLNCYAYQAQPTNVDYFDDRCTGRHIRPVTD